MPRRVAPNLPHRGPRSVALDASAAAARLAYLRERMTHACTACGAAAGRPCADACALSCAWHNRVRLMLALEDRRA